MTDDIQLWEDYKLPSSHILGGICSLVKSLLITDGAGKQKNIAFSSRESVSEEVYHLCLVESVHQYSQSASTSSSFNCMFLDSV